jgi:hypothetical protein
VACRSSGDQDTPSSRVDPVTATPCCVIVASACISNSANPSCNGPASGSVMAAVLSVANSSAGRQDPMSLLAGVAGAKTPPENTISHTSTDRIKQPLTLLDGCRRTGVYSRWIEHTFENSRVTSGLGGLV